jgi:hypothetical protein
MAFCAGAPPTKSAETQTTLIAGNAEDGRTFALRACSGCHVVAPSSYTGPPSPPTFQEIANQPKVTAASLRHHLETLLAVPKTTNQQYPRGDQWQRIRLWSARRHSAGTPRLGSACQRPSAPLLWRSQMRPARLTKSSSTTPRFPELLDLMQHAVHDAILAHVSRFFF